MAVKSTSVKEYSLKPGSHLCDKRNTSDISISISTRKKEHVPFFLCLCLCRLCYAYRTSVNQALAFKSCSQIWAKFKDTLESNHMVRKPGKVLQLLYVLLTILKVDPAQTLPKYERWLCVHAYTTNQEKQKGYVPHA